VQLIAIDHAVDKTSSSFTAHGKIGNFIIITLPGQTRLWNDLLCVEWDVKPYTLTVLTSNGGLFVNLVHNANN